MYSMVLMMALNTGAATPATFFGHGCHGCNGGYACHGGGYGCHGGFACHGGNGCHGGFLSRIFRRHGCHGGGHACHGGYGCHGGFVSGHGCHGGYVNGHGCHGGVVAPAPAPGAPPGPPPERVPVKPAEKKAAPPPASAPAPAKLIVTLPADAMLSIDDRPTVSTSGTRIFVTPELARGKEYYYTLRAEVTRDGEPRTVTQRVTVRAGEEIRTSITLPVATTAAR